MKTSAYILLLFFIFLACTQCRKKEDDTPWQKCEYLSQNVDTINMYIQGKWELVEYRTIERGGAVNILTPETMGYTEYNTIQADQITYTRSKDRYTETNRFKIEMEKDITGDPTDNFPVLSLYDINGQRGSYYRIKICANTLVFLQAYRGDNIPDATYKRIN